MSKNRTSQNPQPLSSEPSETMTVSSKKSLYDRGSSPATDTSETYVSDLSRRNGATGSNERGQVVGFLYSVSNRGCAEYWPLRFGNNTIGRAADNTIRLLEASVSARHAQISIKRQITTNRIIAYVRDVGSTNGIFLNGEELDFDGHSCNNGDVITVGLSYRLLVILIDATEKGLEAAKEFRTVTSSQYVHPTSGKPNPIYQRSETTAAANSSSNDIDDDELLSASLTQVI